MRSEPSGRGTRASNPRVVAVAQAAVRAIAPERLDELARAILAGAAPLRVAEADGDACWSPHVLQ